MTLARLGLLFSLSLLFPPSSSEKGAPIVLSVKERAAPGQKIGFAHPNGQDLPKGLRYRLSHHSRYFRINESSGAVLIKSVFDRERLCNSVRSCCPQTDPEQRCFIPLKVLLEDRSRRPVKIVNIRVLVEDVNDESPQFPTATYMVRLAEDAAVGTPVTIPPATDADTDKNSVKSYKLTRCDENVFNLTYSQLPGKHRSHEVNFVLNKKLDHETKVQYVCRIQASDGAHEEAMDVKLLVEDVNDHAPQWSNSDFRVVLDEDQARYSTIFTLAATDPDQEFGKITFGFGPRFLSTYSHFSLDQKSGAITLNQELNFDANGQQNYQLPIIARDNGMPVPKSVTGTLTIEVTDVNDNAPQITLQPTRIQVDENTPAKYLAFIEVSDKDQGDNGKVTCHLNNFNRWFNLSKYDQGSYGLYSTGPIDREQPAIPANGMLKVEMYCKDGGKSPQSKTVDLMIFIADVNDHRPKFSQSTYTAHLAENQPAGTVFLQLAATDKDAGENAKLEFGLYLADKKTESIADLITVESHSGAVTSAALFDREKKAGFEFSVIVRDRGRPSLNDTAKVKLIINDINDNAPAFVHPSQTTFNVKENAPRGTVVGKINATDKDEGANGSVVFSQRYGRDNSGRMFTVSKTGEIRLKLPLDRERGHEYSLTVQASDEGSPAQTADTTVVINVVDVNDSPPKFEPSTITTINISCDENSVDTFHQAMIRADDPDENSDVVYSLGKQKSRRHQFEINSQTGQLTIAKAPAKCTNNYFKLTVIATDAANRNFFDRKEIHVYVRGHHRPRRPPRISPGVPVSIGGAEPMIPGGHPDDGRGAADFDLNLLIIIILVCTAIVLTFVMLAAALYLRKRQLRAAQEYEKGRREMPDGGTLRRDKEKLGGHHPGSSTYATSLPSSPRKEFDQLKKTNMSMEDMYHEHEIDSKASRLKLADPSCAKLKGNQYCSDITDESGVPLNPQISQDSAHTYQSMASQKESPENAGYTIFQHELFSYIPDTLRTSANVDSKKKKTSQVTISFV